MSLGELNTAQISFQALSKAIFGSTTALSTFLYVAAGVAAVVALVAIIDAATKSYKELKKASDESAKAHAESSQEVEALTAKLAEVQQKIDEINKKEKISPTDQAALDKLDEENEKLERNLALAKKKDEYNAKKEAKDAAEAVSAGRAGKSAWDTPWSPQIDSQKVAQRTVTLNKRGGVRQEDLDRSGVRFDYNTRQYVGGMSLSQETAAMQSAFARYEAEKQKIEQQYLNSDQKMSSADYKRVNELNKYTKWLSEEIQNNIDDLEEYESRLVDAEGRARDGYEDMVFQIEQVLDFHAEVERDPFEQITKYWDEMVKLANANQFDTQEFRTLLGVLTGNDYSTANLDTIIADWQTITNYVDKASGLQIANLFKGDATQNLHQFWLMVQGLGEDWAKFDEKTQTWSFNIDSVEELAEKLHVSEDLVESIIRKTQEAGANIEVNNTDSTGQNVMNASKAESILKKKGILGKAVNIDLNTDDYLALNGQLAEIIHNIDKLTGKDGKINIDSQEGQAAYSLISQLYDKLLELSMHNNIAFHLDTSEIDEGSDKEQKAAKAIHDASVAIADYQTALNKSKFNPNIDVKSFKKKAKQACDAAANQLADLEKDGVELSISADDLNFDEVKGAIETSLAGCELPLDKMTPDASAVFAAIQQSISKMPAVDFTEKLNIDPSAIGEELLGEESTTVTLTPDPTPLDEELAKPRSVSVSVEDNKTGGFYDTIDKVHTVFVKMFPVNTLASGAGMYQGTAYANGLWATTGAQRSLVGELGREIVVNTRTGRWQTVGDNGAEFTTIPSGSIVFNHKQTESLLKYGRINSRGHAYASGTAFERKYTGKWSLDDNSSPNRDSPSSPAGKAAKAVTKAAKSVADDSSKLKDWVEKLLEKLDKKAEGFIKRAEKKAEHGNYAGAARQYRKAEAVYAKELQAQKDAEGIYAAQAAKVLKDAVAKGTITSKQASQIENKVANGAMEVSSLSEGMEKVVSSYEEYYDKAIAVADATAEIYDKYEEIAQKLYQLPLDEAEAKNEKLKKSYDLLEKRIEATSSATKKAAFEEQQIENLRKQHANTAKAAANAKDSYVAAKRKVNEVGDSALVGLSESMKAKVVAKVSKDMTIDVTSMIGLTAAGKQAILDYNAALTAQQDALYNCQMSAAETAMSIREVAESLANITSTKAEEKIDQIDKTLEVVDAKLGIADTRKEKTRLLKKSTSKAWSKWRARDLAEMNAEAEVDNQFKGAVKRAAKAQGKQKGEKLSIAGLDASSKEYAAIVKYNAQIDAAAEARHQTTLAWADAIKTERDNNEQIYEAIKTDAERGAKETLDAAETAGNAYDDLDKSAVKLMKENPGMTYDEAVMEIMRNAEAAYKNAGAKYATMADTLQKWLDENRDNLSLDQIDSIESDIASYRKSSTDSYDQATEVGHASKEYSYLQTQRDTDTARRSYDDIHRKNEMTRAQGGSVSVEDAQAEANALTNLISKTNALVNSYRELRDAEEVGSDAWNDYNDKLSDATEQNIANYNSLAEMKDTIREIKFKPITEQLEDLDAEQAKIQDHMTYMQNLGMQPLVSDYAKLIQNSQQHVDLLKQQRAELQAQLDSGQLTEEEYRRILQQIRECDSAIRQAENDQAGWAKAAGDTVVNGVQSVGNAMSSGASAVASVAKTISDFLKQLRESWDNWRKFFINRIYEKINKIDARLEIIQNNFEIKKELGQEITAEEYIEQAKLNAEKLRTYEQELRPRLQYELAVARSDKGFTYEGAPDPDGSKYAALEKEWYDTEAQYEQLRKEQIKLLNSGFINEVLEPFEKARDYLSDIRSILTDVNDLITDDMLFDASGKLSEHGEQRMAMLASDYRMVQQEIDAVNDAMRLIEAHYAAGTLTDDDYKSQMAKQQDELAKAAQQRRDVALEMADVMREASEKEIESLQNVISARKDALQSKKDYYDYDKNIRSQTKDIQALQAQIAALNGLTDAESKAKKARLEAELKDAQDALNDTVNEHMFELSTDALDKLADALEDAHQEQWDEVISSIHNLVDFAAQYSDKYTDEDAYNAMMGVLNAYGVITNTASGNDISMFSTLFKDTMSSINSGEFLDDQYTSVVTKLNTIIEELKSENLLTDVAKTVGAYDDNRLIDIVTDRFSNPDHQTAVNINGRDTSKIDEMRRIWNGSVGDGKTGGGYGVLTQLITLPQMLKYQFTNNLRDTIFANWIGKEKLDNSLEEQAASLVELFNKIKSTQVFGRSLWSFASGTKRSGKKQLAWTNEGIKNDASKEEWIVRQSDGAILTPLDPSDGVIPPNLTSKLYDLATNGIPQVQIPQWNTPDVNFASIMSPNVTQSFDSLIHVDGNVDAAVISDMKKFARDLASNKELLEGAYKYTSEQMYKGYLHSGGKRQI